MINYIALRQKAAAHSWSSFSVVYCNPFELLFLMVMWASPLRVTIKLASLKSSAVLLHPKTQNHLSFSLSIIGLRAIKDF